MVTRQRHDNPAPPPVVDHPAAAGDLAEILNGRNIAIAAGGDGRVLLARPDSVVVEVPADGERRAALGRLVRERKYHAPDEAFMPPAESGARVVSIELGRQEAQEMSGESRLSIARASEFVAAARAERIAVDLDHVFLGAQTVRGNPLGSPAAWAGEMAFMGDVYTNGETLQKAMLSTAEPAIEPSFRRHPLGRDGDPPRVLVLDTGLSTVALEGAEIRVAAPGREAHHPWLKTACKLRPGWTSDRSPGIIDDEDETFDPPLGAVEVSGSTHPDAADQLLDFEAGHGTFIAGVIEQLCPDAEIHSAGVLSSFGDGDVSGVLVTLRELIDPKDPFDIIVMSFGTHLEDDEPGVFGNELMHLLGDKTLGVAAAGNQSTCRPYFPAALPDIVGVGALAADGKAWFTNFGGWVDACAPGVDVVSTFFDEFDEIVHGTVTRRYRQWARWSGTSFSAPKVAGAIAQEMALHGGSAKQAWKRLSTHQHYRYPDLGVVVNV